ncbi:MAG: 2-isopropylmalate synthase [Lentisphaerae bacterium]|nr:2-isopropylmalate synthase [Lentisphaerota bacterium]
MSCKSNYKSPDPIPVKSRQWPDKTITRPPTWVSVDLRDGNQALPIPMSPEVKLEYFKMLCDIGFKEIEVGFPSASQDDFDFVRQLIEGGHIPADVKISVLTQAREHLIKRTVESLSGVKQAIVHCYVATSDLHGKFVFNSDHQQVEDMAIAGTALVRKYVDEAGLKDVISYEFSPEEFTDSDLDFVIDVCKKVKDTWGKSAKSDFILNLPATVERRPPNQYADMIEYFIDNYPYMDESTISIHAHNDQGCAVAASELALLAGAERAEGTIFGHGERTGNLDILVLAMNLYSRGIETGLDFSELPKIVDIVEHASGIDVHCRHPYAGKLVFTAFSGSHQDAIRKGMDRREEIGQYFGQGWKIPYLHIDPRDVGRNYEQLIRINSQSGKGGVAYVLEKEFGIFAPKAMHPAIGAAVQKVTDKLGCEITAQTVRDIFEENFVNLNGPYNISEYSRITQNIAEGLVEVQFTLRCGDSEEIINAHGNGILSAVTSGLQNCSLVPEFKLEDYSEHTMGKDKNATALAFVGIRLLDGKKLVYGAGSHPDIARTAVAALVSAINCAVRESGK